MYFTEYAETVNHRCMAVCADECIRQGDEAVVVLFRLDDFRQIFQIHLMDDTGFFQVMGKNAQEAADLNVISRKIAELSLTPGAVGQDGPMMGDGQLDSSPGKIESAADMQGMPLLHALLLQPVMDFKIGNHCGAGPLGDGHCVTHVIAVTMAIPADGPSFGIAPSGTWIWTSVVWLKIA